MTDDEGKLVSFLQKKMKILVFFSWYSSWRVARGYWIWKIWRLARKLDERKTRGNLKKFWITNFKNIYHLANLTKITPCRLKTLSETFSDGFSRSLTIQLLTTVYGRDGKKLCGFAYRNHIMVEHSQPDGLVSRYEYDRYDPLPQVCNWTSMPTVRRGCITTSSGIMSLMQGGLLIRIWVGWMVEITYTYLLSIARYGAMHWDFPKLHGGKVALILSLIVQMLQKVMADSNTKNAIPNALRNGGGCWGI